MLNKKYFCYEIYKNISVTSHNDSVTYSPCCIFSNTTHQSDQLNLDQYWNKEQHCQLKENVVKDIEINGCKTCYQSELSGNFSRRLAAKEFYENYIQDLDIDLDAPQGLDYRIGNLCNLKCMICTPDSSTSWISDYQKMYPTADISKYLYKKNNQITLTDDRVLKNLKFLHFHGGGEPLLNSTHVELLQKIKSAKGLNDVRVTYNTNATVRVSDEVLKLWEECQLIELYFSIDDIGRRFEYQRTGANWEEVLKNLHWFYQSMPHNHMFKINSVWSHLNLFYLSELVDWHQEHFSANRYNDPTLLLFQSASGNFHVNHLSKKLHDILLQKFKNYPQLFQIVSSIAVVDPPDYSIFLNYVDKIDHVRGQQFSLVCPEYAELLM